MHRHASLFVLAGLMTATLHAQTPQGTPPVPPPAAPAAAKPSQRTPPPARVATTPPMAPTLAPPAIAQAVPQGTPPPPQPAQTAAPGRGQLPPSTKPPVAIAQTPPPGAPRAAPRSSQNVRVDLTITDGTGQRNADAAAVKVVTMLVADGRQGRIRSSNDVPVVINGSTGYRPILINVDVIPEVLADGRILLNLTMEYTPDLPSSGTTSPRPSSINESLTVLVADGKSTLISQSADPATSRKVSVEVTATIIK